MSIQNTCDFFGERISEVDFSFITKLEEENNVDVGENVIVIDNFRIVELYLREKEIKQIPKEIGLLEKLIILDLGYNLITELPIQINNLASLKDLHIDNNLLDEKSLNITGLRSLEILDISCNNFNELPDIPIPNKIHRLICCSNNIKELPIKSKKLINLSLLDFRCNQIADFPEEIFSLSNLQILAYGFNNFEMTDLLIRRLNTSLQTLTIYE
ncbi:MAG: hypothetical protein HeimC3_40660 [Candidatus Heimdallarchaeota archaeon LC_3]|nr:MAG: hypothetical protein HeimC3_40660 [Candidatus Heimdallarchaeota archaeon LC_3]